MKEVKQQDLDLLFEDPSINNNSRFLDEKSLYSFYLFNNSNYCCPIKNKCQ